MNYREKLYSIYVSTHISRLYGESSIDGIKKQFPVWRRYYGRFLLQDKSASILDIGCGDGGFVYYLKNLGYENSSGIDISPEQVEIARNLGIKDVKCADILGFLRDKKDTYDVIFARDVIEHFTKEDIIELLEVVFNSLKPCGVVIIQTPNGESPFGGRYRYGDFTHEIAFTRSSLNQVLMMAGFEKVDFYPVGPVPKGIKSTVRFLFWKVIEWLLRFYMLVETGDSRGIFTQNIIAVAVKRVVNQ